MKKIKKYEWGTFSASVDKPQMVNPGNAALQQYTMNSAKTAGMPIVTPSSANPNAKSLSDIKLPTSSPNKSSLGFKGFMGDYGNLIGNVGGTIATLIHANKKQDPTGRPYKNGTNMIKTKKNKLIKYQDGIDAAAADKAAANDADIIGPGPLDNFPKMSPKEMYSLIGYDNTYGYGKKEINQALERLNMMGGPISPITPKMAPLKMSQQTPMKVRPNPVSVPKLSRRERKMENARIERLLTKGDTVEPLQPKMPKLGADLPAMQPSLKMVDVPAASKAPRFFNYHSAEAKGGYARALKGGKRDAKGNLIDMETGLIYKDLRQKSSGKSSQPVVKKKDKFSQTMNANIQDRVIAAPSDNTRVNVNYQDNSQLFRGTGHFQAGTKSLTKEEGKVGKGSEYFALAKTLTPEQKAEFRKLDAQAKKEGKTFSFQGLKYDPAAYAAAMSKGKGASKGNAKANTPKTAQHTTDDPGKKMKNPEDLSRYAFGEKPITFMGDTFSIRPSTLEKAGKRGAAVLGSLGWGPLVVPTLASVGTASLIDAFNELTPRGSNFEKYLSNLSKTLDIGSSLAGAAGTTVGVGRGVKAGYGAIKNPRKALKKIKELWSKRMQTNPTSTVQPAVQATAQTGRISGKLGSTQGFNQNPLQIP